MDCPLCGRVGATGCEACGGKGVIAIDRCPLTIITRVSWETIEYAELYAKGLPPVAGGALDQARSFVTAARFIWSQRSRYKAASWEE